MHLFNVLLCLCLRFPFFPFFDISLIFSIFFILSNFFSLCILFSHFLSVFVPHFLCVFLSLLWVSRGDRLFLTTCRGTLLCFSRSFLAHWLTLSPRFARAAPCLGSSGSHVNHTALATQRWALSVLVKRCGITCPVSVQGGGSGGEEGLRRDWCTPPFRNVGRQTSSCVLGGGERDQISVNRGWRITVRSLGG